MIIRDEQRDLGIKHISAQTDQWLAGRKAEKEINIPECFKEHD